MRAHLGPLLRNNLPFSTIFIVGAMLEVMIEITYPWHLKEDYVPWLLLITWMWETALLQERGKKKKKSFTEFQTYKFKRQIRVYLIWMDLWLLGLWSIREQTGSCMLCFHHIFRKLEVRERLWMLNVCSIIRVQVLTAVWKPCY